MAALAFSGDLAWSLDRDLGRFLSGVLRDLLRSLDTDLLRSLDRERLLSRLRSLLSSLSSRFARLSCLLDSFADLSDLLYLSRDLLLRCLPSLLSFLSVLYSQDTDQTFAGASLHEFHDGSLYYREIDTTWYSVSSAPGAADRTPIGQCTIVGVTWASNCCLQRAGSAVCLLMCGVQSSGRQISGVTCVGQG